MYSEDNAEVCRDDEKRCSSSTEGKERVDYLKRVRTAFVQIGSCGPMQSSTLTTTLIDFSRLAREEYLLPVI